MAVDSSSFPQSSTASRGSVAERRKPPPPPSTNRRQCSCPTSASETGSCTDRLHLSADDYRHHHHHHQHQHHHQQQQRHLEQFSHPQHCSQTSSASVRHQSQEGSDGGQPGRLAALCSCHGDPLRRGGSGGSVERQCCPLLLSNAELFQIDLFYRSRKTFVYVCPCPALLYFARTASAGSGGGVASSMSWRFAAAGVPVIVVDTMRGASVGSRLHLVLAERGTGFELWRYRLTDGVQQYAVGEASTPGGDGGTAAAFHTVTVSTGHVAGLCFDDAVSAGDFHRQLLRLDELYSTGGGGSRNRKGKKTRREVVSDAAAAGVGSSCISSSNRGLQGRSKCRTVISKADISQPCCFTHVTRLERGGSRNTAVSSAAADISQRTLAGQTAAVGRTQRIFSSPHS